MDPQTSNIKHRSSQANQSSSSLPQNENHEQNQSPSPNSQNQDALPQVQRVKARRTRTGCLTCRSRKIKCDEAPGNCANCARVMLQCRWPSTRDVLKPSTLANRGEQQGSSSITLARRIRSAACGSCRAAKYKCSRDRPSCLRCSERDLICTYDVDANDFENLTINTTPSPTDRSLTNDRSTSSTAPNLTSENTFEPTLGQMKTVGILSEIDNLSQHQLNLHLDAFFTHVYPCQANAFIHRGTLIRNIQSGQVAKKLILAICAVSSPFIHLEEQLISSPQDSPQVQSWAQEAKKMLILEEDISTDTVGAALLLAKHDINCGKYESAWMLSSIANRVVLALGFYKAGPASDGKITWVEQETRRRLVWACYCLDRMMSTGEPDFVLLRTEHVKIQLPCEEHKYLLGIPCVTPVPNLEVVIPESDPDAPRQAGSETDIGMFGHYVQIMDMRYMILKCTRNRSNDSGQLPPWDPLSTFSQCDRKISAWKQSLPPQFQLLPDTIYARQVQNQLTSLIMLHVWYDQCMVDLYRITLPGFPDSRSSIFINAPIGWVEHHQAACVHHARKICSTFNFVAKHVDIKSKFTFLDGSLPMCVFQSMRVQVQWFFMLSPKEQEETMGELLNEFDKLMNYIERMTKYFSQARWLLKEMRKMLLWHGFPINGAPESNNNDGDGSRPTSHPWLRRIYHLNQESRGDEGIQGSTAANQKNASFNYEDSPVSPFHGLSQRAENLSSDMVFGNEPDMFQQEGMNTLMTGQDQEQMIPDTNSFLGLFGEWAAKNRAAGNDVWSGL